MIILLISVLIIASTLLTVILIHSAGYCIVSRNYKNEVKLQVEKECQQKLDNLKGEHELEKTILFDRMTEQDWEIIRLGEELQKLGDK